MKIAGTLLLYSEYYTLSNINLGGNTFKDKCVKHVTSLLFGLLGIAIDVKPVAGPQNCTVHLIAFTHQMRTSKRHYTVLRPLLVCQASEISAQSPVEFQVIVPPFCAAYQ